MPEPPRTAVQKGDVVAVRDAFGEWHPAIAETGVIRRGVSFPLVRCSLPLREYMTLPFPVEDVLLLADTTLSRARTLRQAVDEPPQAGAVPQVPFEAIRHGERVLVTAVLSRTAVYGAEAEKALDRLEAFELLDELAWFVPVDPAAAARKRGREMASFGKRVRPPRRSTASPAGP